MHRHTDTQGHKLVISQTVVIRSLLLLLFSSCVRLFATPWIASRQTSLSLTIFQSLLKLMSIVSMRPSNHLILCCPLLLLPAIFPSIRVFSNFFFLENLGGGSEQKATVTATKPHEQFLCDSKSSSDGTHPQFYQKAQDLEAEIFWRWGRILCYVDQPAPWLMA